MSVNYTVYDNIREAINIQGNMQGAYLPISGGVMTGAIIQPITPIRPNDLVTKNYVDTQFPDATEAIKGKIQLSGDLSGSASNPVIAFGAITNEKLANLSSTGRLKGSSSISLTVVDIGLGTNLRMNESTLDVNVASLGSSFLPISGGTMTGAIVQPTTPVSANDVVNKSYVDSKITPNATTLIKGKIQLAGDLAGTASEPVISAHKITYSKMQQANASKILLGSQQNAADISEITVGDGLDMNSNVLAVNIDTFPVLPVSKGGTGNSSLNGYLLGTGDTITTSLSIPVASVAGAVGSVNGIAPISSGGNVTVPIGNVTTGVLNDRPPQPQPNGDTYVVSGDPTPSDNGRTFISTGSTWEEITSNLATTDARYILKSGDVMSGNLSVPPGFRVLLADLPANSTDAANKGYVDSQIVAGSVPDATDVIKGKILLAGDLGGSASTPTIASNVVTNPKLAQFASSSQLKGSSSFSPVATDIGLGNGLSMLGATLDVNTVSLSSSFLPLSGGSMTGAIVQPITPVSANDVVNKSYVDAQIATSTIPDATTAVKGKIQLAGDLSGTASEPLISPNAVTNIKLANLSGTSQLKGSTSFSSAAADIILGNGLIMNGTTLDAETTPDATGTIKGKVQLAGDLTGTASDPMVAPKAITNAKLANLSGTSRLKGSSSFSSVATDITLGNGLSMVGTSITAEITPDATDLIKGKIQLAGDLTGTASEPVISAHKITYSKMQQANASKILLGSQQNAADISEITVGNGLDMNSRVLAVNIDTFPVLPVSKGGTGNSSLNGYLLGTGDTITTSLSIPVASVTGAVGSVNGIAPISSGGNVTVPVGNVTTGVLNDRPPQPQPNGDTYVVSGDPTPSDNGRTFISTGSTWEEITSNLATTDARYILKSGDVMSGNLSVPSGFRVLLADLPANSTDAANKGYVDSQVVAVSVPDATDTIKGKVQLSGDLGGSASAPMIASNVVTNPKLAHFASSSQLKGSSSFSSVATDISLGTGLNMSGTSLSTAIAGDTQFGSVKFDSVIGDLTQSSLNSGIGLIKPLSVTNSKLANLTSASQLKGSSSTSSTTTDITLGNELNMSGTTLNVNTVSLSNTFLPLVGGTMTGPIVQPSAPIAANDLANKSYVDAQIAPDATDVLKGKIRLAGDLSGTASAPIIAPNVVTNVKLASLSGAKQLKGSSSTSPNVTDIILGSGLNIDEITLDVNIAALSSSFLPISGGTMAGAIVQPTAPVSANDVVNKVYVDTQIATATIPDATAVIKGKVQLAGDLSGTATAPVIALNAVTNSKLANFAATNRLKGSSSTSVAAADISLGTGLNMSGTTLSTSIAGNTQLGSVKFDPVGDLIQTSLNSGVGLIKPFSVTNSKMANMSDVSRLKGSTSYSPAITDIYLGNGLSMVGESLTVTSSPLIQFTGGYTQPYTEIIGNNDYILYEAFTAYVRYMHKDQDIREIWSYPGGKYMPSWDAGKYQQSTYVAFVPDYSTIDTSKTLKIIEYPRYRDFPVYECAEIAFYTIVIRDPETNYILRLFSYMPGYAGTEYGNKISLFMYGSVPIGNSAYMLTPESSNFKDYPGLYFRLNSGSSKVAGRNHLNDKYSSYVILSDPEIQGGSPDMTVAVAGRGTDGNEGKLFFRGINFEARILGISENVIFEPDDANSVKDYVVVEPGKWTYYKLLVYPASRVIVVQPHNRGDFDSIDEALATTHIYDTLPYDAFDRWTPAIFAGYMGLNGSLKLTANWSDNPDLYAFFNVNKIRI